MKQVARDARVKERILGLVPTMGALHEGHLSLVRAAQKQCSPVVVSIFVNPTQFGPNEDFKKYPRTFDADRAALEDLRVDYIFAPPPEEIYPPGFRTAVTVEGLGDVLEGRVRPGHFRGVTTVVLKLFEIAQPRFAFFGRKDAQQARIIRQMVADLNLDAEIVVCPIVREADGLALSSRNAYLKGAERQSATALYRSLDAMRREVAQRRARRGAPDRRDAQRARCRGRRRARLRRDCRRGHASSPWSACEKRATRCVAARVGATRLIDNALIEQQGDSFRVTV